MYNQLIICFELVSHIVRTGDKDFIISTHGQFEVRKKMMNGK